MPEETTGLEEFVQSGMHAERMERLKAISEQILRKPLAADENLMEAGLNANRALNLIRLFYLETGIDLDVNAFLEYPSLTRLSAMLAEGRTGPCGKLIPLREGKGTPLFIYAGGVNVFLELHDVITAIEQPGPIWGIRMTRTRRPHDDPATVEDEVGDAIAAIRQVHPAGPVRLLGYSFGGVLALEIARRMRAEGTIVEFCGMIDTPQNDHVWPLHNWTFFVLWRLLRKMQRLAGQALGRLPPARRETTAAPALFSPEDLARLSQRGHGNKLVFRFRNPRALHYPLQAPQWLGGNTPDYAAGACELLRMKGLYRPRRHAAPVTFFLSAQGSPVDCDARTIWHPYLPEAEWVPVKGNHLSMVVGRNARNLAAEISRRLATAHDM